MADVVRSFGERLEAARGKQTSQAGRVLRDISDCRTSVLGGHVDRCDRCGREEIAYNSCRNRHCPKCQASARREWLSQREAELLPVPYFHVVFTIPHELGPLAIRNPKVVYEILFRASADTLRAVAADPKHLGAEVGILAILHTWGQSLEHHPHAHCVVTGGGISKDQSHWVPSRDDFFLPVRVLSRMFRGKFLDRLSRAQRRGALVLEGKLAPLTERSAFGSFLRPLYEKEWVVYAKAPFGGPNRVLKYLGRYTHRVAISNQRLVGMDDESVSFRWKDYAHGCRHRVMTLSGVEFLRRFLMHVLPKGFVRIRHSGFLANCRRKKKLALARTLLAALPAHELRPSTTESREGDDGVVRCSTCREGRMLLIHRFERGDEPRGFRPVPAVDTS